MIETAEQCWTKLDGEKTGLMLRTERYAALTIPKICLPLGFNSDGVDQAHDYQSLGAQATNHLTNKIMLALFAPSRPFFRLQTGAKTDKELAAAGVKPEELQPILSGIERKAIRELDKRAQRPKLYTCVRHLIVTGNVLMVLGKESMRIMGLRYFCVKRDAEGKVHTLVIREKVKFDELELKVQAAVPDRHQPDDWVNHYRHIVRNPKGDYEMTQWVDTTRLPEAFNGKWPEAKLPYRVLTWDLGDEADYATGLVEDCIGDFEAMSILSEAVVDGGVLGSEYRWLVKPSGMTSADDFNNSKNGDALPGTPDDIAATQGGNPLAIKTADDVLQKYERRIGAFFLMQSAVTRNAERVTAEEIRLTAQELETAYGGVYSGLATSIQAPIADWLLTITGTSIAGTDIEATIITGLDALSRNGDLDNLRTALQSLGMTLNLPEQLLARIKFTPLSKFVGDGCNVDMSPFLMDDDEFAQAQQVQAQQRVQENTATAHGEAQADAQAHPPAQ